MERGRPMKVCLLMDQRSGPSPTELILHGSSQNLDRAVSYFLRTSLTPQSAEGTLAKIFREVTGAFHKRTIFGARNEREVKTNLDFRRWSRRSIFRCLINAIPRFRYFGRPH